MNKKVEWDFWKDWKVMIEPQKPCCFAVGMFLRKNDTPSQ